MVRGNFHLEVVNHLGIDYCSIHKVWHKPGRAGACRHHVESSTPTALTHMSKHKIMAVMARRDGQSTPLSGPSGVDHETSCLPAADSAINREGLLRFVPLARFGQDDPSWRRSPPAPEEGRPEAANGQASGRRMLNFGFRPSAYDQRAKRHGAGSHCALADLRPRVPRRRRPAHSLGYITRQGSSEAIVAGIRAYRHARTLAGQARMVALHNGSTTTLGNPTHHEAKQDQKAEPTASNPIPDGMLGNENLSQLIRQRWRYNRRYQPQAPIRTFHACFVHQRRTLPNPCSYVKGAHRVVL